ncbi:hypothetical protein AALP_AAs71396U000100 [Arabis alpina]|uniref:Uncharacterized protein n=1 Tax=Arabis alpina TaxID=50452 RepID=A0A087G045_ARAAL|nr:hypothetical protein AALP_AAs71396U000100 [Arabis alpina]
MTLLVVDVAQIIPNTGSDSVPNPASLLAIPLTFFDLPFLWRHPFKQVFFYRLTESTREHFHSFILPKLKLSLSLVLRSYLPLSGCITWNSDELKPRIVVSQNDAVSVTIAETDANFSNLSSYGQRPVSELHTLIPELPCSDDLASAFSLQITLFPNQGFSIGFAAHHAVLDGNTSSMFIKAWAHLCKQHIENRVISLPESLTPSLDRSLLKDVTRRLDEQMIEMVRSLRDEKTNFRSLSRSLSREIGDDDVQATLVLSRDDIERLRERCMSRDDQSHLHLSTFVIAYAYVWTCFVKARGGDGERAVSFFFGGDFRRRLDPPLPATYFGNCIFKVGYHKRKAAEFAGEKGFLMAVEMISDLVKSLSSPGIIETIAQRFRIGFDSIGESSQIGRIAMSNKFGVYNSDFGWGRPVKVDYVSTSGEGIALAERRDESGGIEMGICMKKTEMDMVFSCFKNSLQN